eukprot:GEMP01043880.1.p1 GENE.GEMP01043880.1~~GEMP01043880.1.p1  ORF type:complete len:365 (+),score=87.86 GEMP01043880.1:22-1095(+)
MRAQQLVEAWRLHLRRRFPQFPHLVDQQVQKVIILRSSKTLTAGDLQELEAELAVKAKGSGRLRSAASEPAFSTCSSHGAKRPPSAGSCAPSFRSLARSDSSLGSKVRLKPSATKMLYPRQPITKPLDIWDHIVRYDASKHFDAELTRPDKARNVQSMYKLQLDAQMEEMQWKKQMLVDGREKDREAIEREKNRYKDDLERDRERRSQERCRLAQEMLHSQYHRERKLERERALREVERHLILDREASQEEADRVERARANEIVRQRRSAKLQEFQDNIEERERQKQELRVEEHAIAKRYIADMDAREEQKQVEVIARQNKMKAMANSVGEANKNAIEMLAKADEMIGCASGPDGVC